MIHPDDQDTIRAMIGTGMDVSSPPTKFVDEYLIRMGMLARAGKPGALGPVLLVGLLRDFGYESRGQAQQVAVTDWNSVSPGTVITYQGQRGVFKGATPDGYCIVKVDGRASAMEVPRSMVMLSVRHVDGMDDADFVREQEPAAAKLTEPAAYAARNNLPVGKNDDDMEPGQVIPQASKSDDQPTAHELEIAKWLSYEGGEKVFVNVDGKTIQGDFIDINQDKKTLLVSIKGRRRAVDPFSVSPEPVEAATA